MRYTRREVLIIFTTPTVLLVAGCGGSGGNPNSQTLTVLEKTRQELGLEPIIDPERSFNGYPYVSQLLRNQDVVKSGALYFTINGQAFHDEGQEGTKSVQSLVRFDDVVEWHQF